MNWSFSNILLLSITVLCCRPGLAQNTRTAEEEAAYTRTITERADKIVKTLEIADTAKATRVRTILAQQYRNLSNIHDGRDATMKETKKQLQADKAALDVQLATLECNTSGALNKVHIEFLSALYTELTSDQIEKIKDGMTFGVLPITYQGYQDMLPTLTEEQKRKILAWLVEAREYAMDAGSSEKKHGWFGKYKGRINNYLSAEGYDLKKSGDEWEKRRKASQQKQ